jgi:hypothetical protein
MTISIKDFAHVLDYCYPTRTSIGDLDSRIEEHYGSLLERYVKDSKDRYGGYLDYGTDGPEGKLMAIKFLIGDISLPKYLELYRAMVFTSLFSF